MGERRLRQALAAAVVAALGIVGFHASPAAAATPPVLTATVSSNGSVSASWSLPTGQSAQIVYAGKSNAVNQYGELTDHTGIGQLSSGSATSTSLSLQAGTWYLQVWTKVPADRTAAPGCPIVVSPYPFCYSNIVTVVVPGATLPTFGTPTPTLTLPSPTTAPTTSAPTPTTDPISTPVTQPRKALPLPTLHSVTVSGLRVKAKWTIPAGQRFLAVVGAHAPWLNSWDSGLQVPYGFCEQYDAKGCADVELWPETWWVQVRTIVDPVREGYTCEPKHRDRIGDICHSNVIQIDVPSNTITNKDGSRSNAGGPPSAQRIGGATDVRGTVEVQQADGSWKRIAQGAALRMYDRVRTGPDGRMQAKLLDDTLFTLGKDGEMVLDEFVYDARTPPTGKIAANVTKGMFRWVTGKVKGNEPGNKKVTLPVMTIGIRGTDFVVRYDPKTRTTTVLTNTGFVTLTPNATRHAVNVAAGRMATVTKQGKATVKAMKPQEWKAALAGL